MSYGEHRLGQGREKAREFLKENMDLAKKIEAELLQKFMPIAGQSALAVPRGESSSPARAGASNGGARHQCVGQRAHVVGANPVDALLGAPQLGRERRGAAFLNIAHRAHAEERLA